MAKKSRHDILIVAMQPQQRVPESTARSLIENLVFSGYAVEDGEAQSEEWLEVYLQPGPSAHVMFSTGGAEGDTPVFRDAVVRIGSSQTSRTYGPAQVSVYALVEFRGARFKDVTPAFRQRIWRTLGIRPRVMARRHTRLAPRKALTSPAEAES